MPAHARTWSSEYVGKCGGRPPGLPRRPAALEGGRHIPDRLSVGLLDVSEVPGLARLGNDGHDPGHWSWYDQLMFDPQYEALHPKTSAVVRDGAAEFRRYEAHTLHTTGKSYLGHWFAVRIDDAASGIAIALEFDGERALLVAPQDHARGQVFFVVDEQECTAAPGFEATHREGVGIQGFQLLW